MPECVVYWLHDAFCICVQRHGYVGISTQWNKRLAQHQRNKRFPPFDWSILFSGSRAECLVVENILRPEAGIGWNRSQGGKPVVNFTPEVRLKLSASLKLREPVSEVTRQKLKLSSTGRTNRGRRGQIKSEEECLKISRSHVGKTHSASTLQKMSSAKLGNKSHLGHRHSEETKKRIGEKKTGVPIHTDEHKEQLRQRMKGNAFTKGTPWSAARRLAWLINKEN